MQIRPHVLSDINYTETKKNNYTLAVLPWGSCEPHNMHLPYSTDTIQSQYIAETAAGKSASKGAKVIVLPPIPYGVNIAQLCINMTINMNPSTQMSVLQDIVGSLQEHGLNKLLIINGHGGNEFKPIIRELQLYFPEFFIGLINWWKLPIDNKHFDEPGEHAGELETSNLMVIKPELVLPLSSAGEGKVKSFELSGFREGWAWSPRPWDKITSDSGIGNPAKASAEKGKAYLDELTDMIAGAITDLASKELDRLFD